MDNTKDSKEELYRRQKIASINEKERQALLDKISKEEAITLEKASHSKKKASIKGLFENFLGCFPKKEIITPIEGDFSTERETENSNFPISEPIRFSEANTPSEDGNAKTEPFQMLKVSDKFAFLIFKALDDTDSSLLEQAGEKKWKEQFCKKDSFYYVLLHPCRLNKNALESLCKEFQSETKIEMVFSYVSSDGKTRPGALFHTAIFTCEDLYKSYHRKKQLMEPYQQGDIEKITEIITRSVEPNIAEQIRRQYEMQLEESGDIYEDEIEPAKTSDQMTQEEYDSYLTPEQQLIKRQAMQKYVDDDIFIEQVLHNVRKHNTIDDPLYLIAIASVDMNTLVILEDITDFECLCESQGMDILQCSYIYAVSKSGGHWYGNNNATKDIEALFGSLSDVIVNNGGVFRKELLYAIPNISIFKDIYFQ